MARNFSVTRAAALALSAWVIAPMHASAGTDGAVACFERDRNIIQMVLPRNCAGRIVGSAEADRLRAKAERRRDARAKRRIADVPVGRGVYHVSTAFPVDGSGRFLTARHGVRNCGRLTLERAGGVRVPVSILSVSPSQDLALVSAHMKTRPLVFAGTGAAPSVGSPVAALGFPRLKMPVVRPVRTSGRMVARNARVGGRPMLAFKGDIHPGNSGGPLLSRDGRVVGVVVATIDSVAYYKMNGRVLRDLGFAVPGRVAADFLRRNGVDFVQENAGKKTSGDEPATVYRLFCELGDVSASE
jgi:S1-C subfamily serine protease